MVVIEKERIMIIEDFRDQEKAIQNDNRYSFEMKQWAMEQSINVFREINSHSPYESGKESVNA